MQSVFRFWFFKFVALVAIMVGAFYIPDRPFTYGKTLRIWVSRAVAEKLKKVVSGLCFCSVVCYRLLWSFLLHPDPAGAAGGLCSLLE